MMPRAVSQERLTRQELSWLLAQEARGAAKALREGVTQLKLPAVEIGRLPEVESNLDALDEAIDRLTELQSGEKGKPRRGRIDLAALLYEVAPNARIAIEPGAGTEVFGEEGDLKRLLSVLVSQTQSDPSAAHAASPDITIRRQDEWVKVTVELGPDISATAELERRWLSRMAVRHGGRLELEGGTESLLLPADGASDQREVIELRKELEQAQQLGEAYARELATMLGAGELPSEPPRAPSESSERFTTLAAAAGAIQRPLRWLIDGLRADVAELGSELGETHEVVQSLLRRATTGAELLFEIERVAQCPEAEPARRLELAEVVREVVAALEPRAARHGVELSLELAPAQVNHPRGLLALFVRALVDNALLASPRGSQVVVRVEVANGKPRLAVEDAGPVIPAAHRADLVQRRLDPSALGRPHGLSLLVADAVASVIGVRLELTDSERGRFQVEVRL